MPRFETVFRFTLLAALCLALVPLPAAAEQPQTTWEQTLAAAIANCPHCHGYVIADEGSADALALPVEWTVPPELGVNVVNAGPMIMRATVMLDGYGAPTLAEVRLTTSVGTSYGVVNFEDGTVLATNDQVVDGNQVRRVVVANLYEGTGVLMTAKNDGTYHFDDIGARQTTSMATIATAALERQEQVNRRARFAHLR
jgi:hypothetical protein